MRLLFTCAHWHALAKLRMHTDLTLDIMDEITTALGKAFRDFHTKVCPAYSTRELRREAEARQRRLAKKVGKASSKSSNSQARGRSKKEYQLQTYKFHVLGDYVKTIRDYGTTDSYSSQSVSVSCTFHLFYFDNLLTSVGRTRTSQTKS